MVRQTQDKGPVTVDSGDAEPVATEPGAGDEGKGPVTVKSDEGKPQMGVSGDEGEAVWKMTDEAGRTTAGSVTRDVTEADLGLKFYPGANVEHGSKMTTAGKAGSWVVALLTTKDPVDKVGAFYKEQYGEGNQVIETGGSVLIVISASGGQRKTVTITRDEVRGVTRIAMSSGSL